MDVTDQPAPPPPPQQQPIGPTTVAPRRSGRHNAPPPTGIGLTLLSILALGVVYGDIGTSPLYTVSECFGGEHASLAQRVDNVLGVISLIIWSLLLAISVKYLGFVLRADNRGEGGILALSALVSSGRGPRMARALTIIGLVGAAFLYSDGMITPAISVLSSIEGLEVASPGLKNFVVPITLVILVMLFMFQYRGTARVGAVFGPVMAFYFLVIAALGVRAIVSEPRVLWAVDPRYAVRFLLDNGAQGYLVLGGVFLAVTGGEALYADLGHFGRRPIRLAWFVIVLPALLLNYCGQGALLLRSPSVENIYYGLAPAWAQLPLVVVSSAAAIIASQAVISGTFSLTAQAIQLGYCPRMAVRHTSETAIGQIYVPAINWTLMLACLGLVVGFGSSSHLAAAYGVAIATTMVVTSILFFFAARQVWGWPWPVAALLTAAFLVIDLAFFGANIVKVAHGGWFPLLVTAVIFTLVSTWNRGRQRLASRMRASALPIEQFLADVRARPPVRVPGTAVFMAGNPAAAPSSMLHNLKHNKVLHERVIILTVRTEPIPFVVEEDRCTLVDRGQGFFSLTMRFGFKEEPNVPLALAGVRPGFTCKPLETSYFLGRETILVSTRSGMPAWRRRLFAWMSRNALNASAFFSLPPNRVVELGMHIEI
jgi:KUP system potassium uptake protein